MEITIENVNDEFFSFVTKKEPVLNLSKEEVLTSGEVEVPVVVPDEIAVPETPHPLGMKNLAGHSWFNGTSWGVN